MENCRDTALPLGVMTSLGADPLKALQNVRDLGVPTCQLGNPPDEYVYGDRAAELTAGVRAAVAATGIRISAVFIMFTGHIWDLVDGPRTIGLVPEETRAPRVVHACRISNWAREIGVPVVASHMGFIPIDSATSLYKGFIETMKAFVDFCASNNQIFAFETGQEPPAVLRRTIDDIGRSNVGVNLDPANLLLYGMGTPMQAVESLGKLVVNTHCKDGRMPQTPGKLGPEMPIGKATSISLSCSARSTRRASAVR